MNGHSQSSLIQRAFEAYHDGDIRGAESFLRQALTDNPGDMDIRMHLANLYYAGHRYVEAIEILQSCKTDTRCALHYHWCRLLALWAEGNERLACQEIDSFYEIRDIAPDQIQMILDIARQAGDFRRFCRFAKKCGEPEALRSLKWITSLVWIFRFIPRRLLRKIVVRTERFLTGKGRRHSVRWLMESARYVDPSNPEWLVKIGQWRRRTRDVYDPQFDREKSWYLTALRLNPQYPEALAGYLRTLYDKQQWGDCLDLITKTPGVLLPDWTSALQAACLANTGRYEEARQRWDKMVKEDNNLHARFCLGLLALEKRDGAAAKLLLFANEDRSLQSVRHFFSEVAYQPDPSVIDGQVLLDILAKDLEDTAFLQSDLTNAWKKTEETESPANNPENMQSAKAEPSVGAPCFLCGSVEPRIPLWRDRTTNWLRSRCPGCSMISVSPLPPVNAVQAMYMGVERQNHSLRKQYKEGLNQVLQMSETASRRLPLMQDISVWDGFDWMAFESSLSNGKRCLDIGCSAGNAVKVLSNCGWQAEGIDLDAEAVCYGQERGLPLRIGSLEDFAGDPQSYHLITLIDVIEHLPDPVDCLRRCFTWLVPGGLIFIKTPCADSLPHRFVGNAWLESSEHLHFFSRRTMMQLLERTGFQIVKFKQTQEAPTNFLHDKIWQSCFYPRLLNEWIHRLKVGDTLMMLARKVM